MTVSMRPPSYSDCSIPPLSLSLEVTCSLSFLFFSRDNDEYGVCIYIHYIHPELRIWSYPSGTGKGAGPLQREQRGSKGAAQRGSTEGALREHGGIARSTVGQCRGAAGESLRCASFVSA